MKHAILLLVSLVLFPAFVNAQLEKVIIEKYYIADANDATDVTGGGVPEGAVTYRIYLDLAPNCKLVSLFGDNNHPFRIASTQPFYNNIADGQTFAKDIVKPRYGENTMALDTWLTLGQSVKKQGPMTYFGTPKVLDDDGSFIGGINNDGGSQGIASGLLSNANADMGIPLTTSDGMDTLNFTPSSWSSTGLLDFVTGADNTIFGSLAAPLSFESSAFEFSNSGVYGVVADSNQVLIAQLTTTGELSFAINATIEQWIDGLPTLVKYVSLDTLIASDELFNPYLNYPYQCGCTDPRYIEYNSNFICSLEGACQQLAHIGCLDSLACNYDPSANVHIQDLCCYPGMCAGRNIVEVCPNLIGEDFEFRIYPVPTEEVLNLNIVSGISGDCQYTIYNAFGSVMKSENLGNVVNSVTAINVGDFNAGVYQVQVNCNGKFKSQLFLKL